MKKIIYYTKQAMYIDDDMDDRDINSFLDDCTGGKCFAWKLDTPDTKLKTPQEYEEDEPIWRNF